MTIYNEVKAKLEAHPQFRERRTRAKYLTILALRSLDLEEQFEAGRLTLENMADFANKYDSYRHEYDAVLKESPELRGTDYQDGKALAQEKQISFGYSVGHYQDVKLNHA